MYGSSTWSLKNRLKELDWTFIKGSAALSIGSVIARILGFAYSLVLAAIFLPEEFGAVKYAITLGGIAAIVTQPFGQHVLARFVGLHQHDNDAQKRFLANAWVIALCLLCATIFIVVSLMAFMKAFDIGVLFVFLGTTVFYSYWGLASGFQAPYRLTIAYLASNIVQIALVGLFLYWMNIRSPQLAVTIYGISYFIPLALLQIMQPLPLNFQWKYVCRTDLFDILKFSVPVWLSHAGYVIFNALPILFLEYYVGKAAVGVYSASLTLTMVYLFVPQAMAALLLPRAASLPKTEHRKLMLKTLSLSFLVNFIGLILYIPLLRWVVNVVYGPAYLVSMNTYILLSIAMIAFGSHSIITAILVGGGKASYETLSRMIALICTAIAGWYLIPHQEVFGTALTEFIGVLALLGVYGVIGWRLRFGTRSRKVLRPIVF
ncbi:oligosaccharide flippase family protein [Chloroflexi bacterium TSY]|nr:oligosaccharide flippase family protein [Chloroflexi bacterium TSY]